MTEDDVRAARMAAILAAAVVLAGKDTPAEWAVGLAKRLADYIIHGDPP